MTDLLLILSLVAVATAALLTLLEVHGDDRTHSSRPAPRSHPEDPFVTRNRR